MAEIKIEKKTTIWPWIFLSLVILAALIYFIFFRKDNDDNINGVNNTELVAPSADTSQMNNNRTVNNGSNGAVDNYVSFINSDTATMGLDHVFTNNALARLIDATQSKADDLHFDVKANLAQAREDAMKITNEPASTSHADYIKDALNNISIALQNMQEAKYPAEYSAAKAVKNAAADLSTSDLTLDQKQTVKKFFREAAALLQKMN